MQDTDLYRRILGLEKPWFVKKVDLQVTENRVDIWLDSRSQVALSKVRAGTALSRSRGRENLAAFGLPN
jgi:hypothetical protein